MAKAKNAPELSGSKNTIPDKTVYLNMGLSTTLLQRIKKYQLKLGTTSEQEAIRIGMNLFLTMNGF